MDELNNSIVSDFDNDSSDSDNEYDYSDFDLSFQCPKCGDYHISVRESEYNLCIVCDRFCCKNCRTSCDECKIIHCFRCSSYFDCCKNLCSNCWWYCFYDDLEKCKCITPYECLDCGIVVGQSDIIIKNETQYCIECNINHCQQCNDYLDYNQNTNICNICSNNIKNVFDTFLPHELSLEILSFVHETY